MSIKKLKRFYSTLFWDRESYTGFRCSGYRVYPDGTKCAGCSDCDPSLRGLAKRKPLLWKRKVRKMKWTK